MGAMRLPIHHATLFDLIDYVNVAIDEKNALRKQKAKNPSDITEHPKIKLIDYFYDSKSKAEYEKSGLYNILRDQEPNGRTNC